MSSTPAAPVADPANPPSVAPATAPAPTHTAETLRADLKGFSAAQADQLLAAPVPAPVAPATPAAPVTPPPTEPPAPAVTPPVTPPPVEPDPNAEAVTGRFRIETTNYVDAEALRLVSQSQAAARKNPALKVLSLDEALTQVRSNLGGTKPTEPAATTTPPVTPANDPVAKINEQVALKDAAIVELDKKLAKAADDMDMPTLLRLNNERTQAMIDRTRLTDQAERIQQNQTVTAEQRAEQFFRQKEREHTMTAVNEFPVLGDKKSPERADFDQFIALKAQDPEYASVFDSPRWPIILARDFAEAKGIKPSTVTSTATPPATTAPATPAATAPTVSPAAARATSATVIQPGSEGARGSFTPSPEQLKSDIAARKFTSKQLDEMLAKPVAA